MPTIRKPRSGNPYPSNDPLRVFDSAQQRAHALKNTKRHQWNSQGFHRKTKPPKVQNAKSIETFTDWITQATEEPLE